MYTYPWRVSHSYFCIESSHFVCTIKLALQEMQRVGERRRQYVNMQTLSRVREKFCGVKEGIVVTIYPVFSSQPKSRVELCTQLNLFKKCQKRVYLRKTGAFEKRRVRIAVRSRGSQAPLEMEPDPKPTNLLVS